MEQRLERARHQMRERDIAALLVGPSADLRYLVGYDALPLERLTLLVVPVDAEARLIVPQLEVARAEDSGAADLARLAPWGETQDPVALLVDLLGAGGQRALAVQDHLWTSFTLAFQQALPKATWVPGSQVTGPLRLRKDPDEQERLREVGRAIDRVHAQVPELLRPGRTEKEVGRDIAELILADHDEVSFIIVGSGPNGASPHHETGERVLETGDAVVVDIGGVRRGYCSDCTRDYVVGEAPPGYDEVHDLLQRAQQAAVEAVRPGVRAQEVDAAAREPIVAAGYGEYFIHRTGHGIGVESHEEPWIVAGNALELAPGMAFSIEPGIYLPGRFGARIEDIVLVTDDGVERLNERPREALRAG